MNRTEDGKSYGLIVDYWGVSDALQEALEVFAPSDVKGAMTPKTDELPRLQARHAAAMRYFGRVKDKRDLHACARVIEPDDVRAEFNLAFRRFAQSLDMMLPDPRALPYVRDMRWLGQIRAAAAASLHDDRLDISDCGAKVRKLIEESIVADGIEILVKKVGLFTKDFDEKMAGLKTDEARASEMEHAIRAEIHVRLDEDPAFYTSLRERLEQIIEDGKARRIDQAKQLELMAGVKAALGERGKAAEELNLSDAGLAIYGLLREPQVMRVADSRKPAGGLKVDGATRDLAEAIEELLAPHLGIVDWALKNDVQREMRRVLRRKLAEVSYPADQVDSTAAGIIDLMKARRGR